jgi:hypothetical protein
MADSSTSQGSSVSAFLSSFIINGIIFLVFFGLFLLVPYPFPPANFNVSRLTFLFSFERNTLVFMNRKHSSKLYRRSTFPTISSSVDFRKRTEPLPSQKFAWIMPLLKSPDPYIIDHSGLVHNAMTVLMTGWILLPSISQNDDGGVCRGLLRYIPRSLSCQRYILLLLS